MSNQIVPRSIYARSIIIDTGPLKALVDEHDGRHAEAQLFFDEIRSRDFQITITNVTIFESYSRILYDVGFHKASYFVQNVGNWSDETIRITEEDEMEGIVHLLKYNQNLSYIDALNFSVMLRLGIDKAFSFDRHFTFPGFSVIPVNYFLD